MQPRPREVTFAHDAVNEMVVIAAALVSSEIRKKLTHRFPPDIFLAPEHRVIWDILREASRRGLDYDPATVATLSGGAVDAAYLVELVNARPEVPSNLDFHLSVLQWDRAKHVALTGPVNSLLEAMQDPKETPGRIRAIAEQVPASLRGYEDRRNLHDAGELVREQISEVRLRIAGHTIYPYGIPGLDYFESNGGVEGKRRVMPGAAPGQVTVITGVPGMGKSSVTARIALGIARQKRKVLYGAWEQGSGVTLELLAVMSLGWSRSVMIDPKSGVLRDGITLEEDGLVQLEERMHAISKYVRFLSNPFRRRRGHKASNEANLDAIEGYIADSGCEVFIADLWRRCLHKQDPEEEELALYQQQTMAEERKVHCILVQQQRLKDVEARPDKRPTREGIKGSGTWVEIADCILGVHRPGAWKPVEDNVMRIDILKQRYGKWPLSVEFEWDGDRGSLEGGASVEYEMRAESNGGERTVDEIMGGSKRSGGFQRRRA